MSTTLYAQPYDISAVGFYFADAEEYDTKASACRNDFGQPVEEFEIQFIDGEAIDAALAEAWDLNQANFARFLDVVDEWDDHGKERFIVAVGECGCDFDPATCHPDDFDVDLYAADSLKELAEQFVDDGLYGEIPVSLAFYIDYEAMARDLSVDYAMTEIAGRSCTKRKTPFAVNTAPDITAMMRLCGKWPPLFGASRLSGHRSTVTVCLSCLMISLV